MNDHTIHKKKYVPHLPSLLALGDHNYARFMRLLPDCDTQDMTYHFCVEELLSYSIEITDCARYTTTVDVKQIAESLPNFLKPAMTVRLYHDAKSAEVISCQHVGNLKASYEYPNLHMHQKNEKFMVNVFLSEWLQFCIAYQNKMTAHNS
ncbi:MAG: DUF1249 domain-containing protein [Glaciecola sp.]|uniref:DUF1249 domain-containing protein n=1 Tax=Glaciecola sp. HTCC2999 TaxID=455436 RepID=UPI0000E0E447|nr:DUF1249 domain-containing protein [Glaciecola sp. HTCC2999]MCH1414336.1 DUF1249 domain-containing protein [Glaciecola sp.]